MLPESTQDKSLVHHMAHFPMKPRDYLEISFFLWMNLCVWSNVVRGKNQGNKHTAHLYFSDWAQNCQQINMKGNKLLIIVSLLCRLWKYKTPKNIKFDTVAVVKHPPTPLSNMRTQTHAHNTLRLQSSDVCWQICLRSLIGTFLFFSLFLTL